jgi:multimeric flavodoxin WrbA
MNALMIVGSRDPHGRTAQTAAAVAEGLAEKGFACETVFLVEKDIRRCRQCNDDGWGPCRNESYCVIDDDFAELLQRMQAADVLVFATPVYMAEPSESMKTFGDRLRRVSWPEPEKVHLKNKPALGICVAGGGGGGAIRCCGILDGILQTSGFDVVDMVPVRRQNMELKLNLLRITGSYLAK